MSFILKIENIAKSSKIKQNFDIGRTFFFRVLRIVRGLTIKNMKSAIFHSIKLPFDAEVNEKFLNVI